MIKVGIVIVGLAVFAHSRHQTIGQVLHGAVTGAGSAISAVGGTVQSVTNARIPANLEVAPTHGPMSAPVTVTGTGYGPHEKVEITAFMKVLATPVTNGHGRFRATIEIPADTPCPDSQCTITARGQDSLKWTTTPYNVSSQG